jgi:VIT1/CCC1 family predicted Fe2+/Mn2+ transporter
VRMPWESLAIRLGGSASVGLDPTSVRARVVDANDGIIATAGIVEGFAGAGATGRTIVIAAFFAMLAGGISLAGAKYAEAAAELEARLAVIDQERHQLEISPQEELDELVALYEAKGLSTPLAEQVALELTAKDPLAAHVEAEHGLGLEQGSPLATAVPAGLAFAAGSSVPLFIVLVAPDAWRVAATFTAVLASLALTSLILARSSQTNVARILTRTLMIGTSAMLLSLAGGHLFTH